MGKKNIWLRRVFQALFLGLWIFLFWKTAHQSIGPVPPDAFLVTDPLVGLLTTVASRTATVALIGGAAFLLLTLIFGRFFCGWVCPLGTVLDIVGRLWVGRRETKSANDTAWRRVKYYLLVALTVSAVLGGPLLYLFDPLVILFRSIALGAYPTRVGEGSFLPLLILLAIIGLTGITHRFWCRYLCPLGALYGVFARVSLFRRRRSGCDGCKLQDARMCTEVCAMQGAVMKDGMPEECVRCMACESVCPAGSLSFKAGAPLPSQKEVLIDLDRRTFVLSLGTGAVAGYAAANATTSFSDTRRVVRPPMVFDEVAFSALCVRCGQCIRSCPTGTLQPLLLEAGFGGLWTPAVTPRINGCKDNCNACSAACPSHAVPEFGPKRTDKWIGKMGAATFDAGRCITYADDVKKPCLKCAEVCPNKAIVIDFETQFPRPTGIVYDRCVGCGQCETACTKMVVGKPAMELYASGQGEPVVLLADPTPVLKKSV